MYDKMIAMNLGRIVEELMAIRMLLQSQEARRYQTGEETDEHVVERPMAVDLETDGEKTKESNLET